MPILDMIIAEASSMIIEPISEQIVGSLLHKINVSQLFEGNVYITNDYTKSSVTTGPDHNALIAKNRCDVKSTVVWNQNETKWDVNSFNFTQAYGTPRGLDAMLLGVYEDRPVATKLVEHQVPCSMALEFTMLFMNREEAFTTISALTNSTVKDSVYSLNDLYFNYPVNNQLLACLYQIYTLRKSSIKVSFEDYLQKTTNGAIGYFQQRTGLKKELVLQRRTVGSLGLLEYSQTAPGVIEEGSTVSRFSVEFSYAMQFARPDALRLSFPVTICNQMVPSWMIPSTKQVGDTALGVFQEKGFTSYYHKLIHMPYVTIKQPIYDDFVPPPLPARKLGFYEFFIAALLLDETPTTQINLLDLGDGIKLNDTLIAIMKLHGRVLFDTIGLVNLSVYCTISP